MGEPIFQSNQLPSLVLKPKSYFQAKLIELNLRLKFNEAGINIMILISIFKENFMQYDTIHDF